MATQMIFVHYNGEWDGNNYVGGDSIIAVAKKDATFDEFVNHIYIVTGIDRIQFDIQIYYIVRGKKYLVKNEHNLLFFMVDEGKYKDIYVDMIMWDVEVSMRSAVPAQLYITDGQNQFVSGTASNHVSDTAVALESEECQNPDIDNNAEIHISDDQTTYRSSEGEEEDAANVDGTNDRGDEQIPEVTFSGFQFVPNPLQEYWVVPGAEDYEFEPTETEESTSFQRGAFYRGAIFPSKDAMKMALGKHSLVEKYEYRIRRSCSVRFEAGCKDVSCKFEIRARRPSGCSLWHVVKCEREHDCVRDIYEAHFRSVKSMVIGGLYASKVVHSTYTPHHVMGEMAEQYGVQVMYTKAWRSLQYAKCLAYGRADESYQQLPSYLHMLKETNPGSLTAIETDAHNQFLYSFFALAGSLHGFRSGYVRPVIAVDATSLKGEYKGVIFTATCKDGEEMIYPIAFGFGDKESDDSWTWFMSRLREAIGVPAEDLVIVSDRHTSIGAAMKIVFPSVLHLCCYVHLKENMKKYCKRKDVFRALYYAAYSYLESHCDQYLAEIESMHQDVHRRLLEVGVERWSRAYCPKRRWFMMTTNIAESINKCMRKARRLPITTAHEFLRHMLQKWFNSRREAGAKLTSNITGAATQHIKEAHNASIKEGGCQVFPIVEQRRYLVKHAEQGDGIVQVVEKSCSCRRWDLDGLPCIHVIAVARYCNHCLVFS